MARVCSRVTGDEMPTEATISPCGSRIGAATHLHFLDVLPIVDRESVDADLRADAGETRHRLHRPAGVDLQRLASEQVREGGQIAVGEQRLAVRGAVQRRVFSRLSGDGDDLPRRDLMVDEEHLDALANREVRRLAQRRGEVLQVVMEERARARCARTAATAARRWGRGCSPCCPSGGQEPALPQRVGQPEDAAAVDADQVGELPQRHRLRTRPRRLRGSPGRGRGSGSPGCRVIALPFIAWTQWLQEYTRNAAKFRRLSCCGAIQC